MTTMIEQELMRTRSERDDLREENARLREALEWIVGNVSQTGYSKMAAVHKARETLGDSS